VIVRSIHRTYLGKAEGRRQKAKGNFFLQRHPMFAIVFLKSEYLGLMEGCGRAGNQSNVSEPRSSSGMIDLPTSTS